MVTALVDVILAADDGTGPLIAPAPVIAGVAALVFLMLGLVTFTYRDVANRHSHKSPPQSGHDTGH